MKKVLITLLLATILSSVIFAQEYIPEPEVPVAVPQGVNDAPAPISQDAPQVPLPSNDEGEIIVPTPDYDTVSSSKSGKKQKQDHQCVHDNMEIPMLEPQVFNDEQAEINSNRNLGVSNPQPIRVTFDTTNLQAANLPSGYESLGPFLIKQLEVAKKYFEDHLSIDRLSGNNIYSSAAYSAYGDCQGDTPIPASDLSTGISNSDLHIYVITEVNSSASYLANAGACYYYLGQRPTFGRIAFNLYYLGQDDLTLPTSFQGQLEITVHEMTHVLGFSGSLFPYFINPSTGNTYYADGISPTTTQTIRGVTTTLLKTPNVLAVAKSHFNCATMVGMQIENNGSSGSAGSHWEKTILFDELMNPQAVTTKAYLSDFTLALLEDSGWYVADYSDAETTQWGYQQGCGFLDSVSATTYDEFATSGTTGCTFDYSSFGYATYSTFTSESGGSNIAYYLQAYNNRHCRNAETAATETTVTNLPYGFYFGDGGRCAVSNLIQNGYSVGYFNQCHKFSCDSSNNISVIVNNETYPCTAGGTCSVTLKGSNLTLKGTVYTPSDATRFCSVPDLCPNACSQNGYCLSGVCTCISGYTGSDCSTVI